MTIYMESVRVCEISSEWKGEKSGCSGGKKRMDTWGKLFGLWTIFLSWKYSQVSMATTPSFPDGEPSLVRCGQAMGWTLVDTTLQWMQGIKTKGGRKWTRSFKLSAFADTHLSCPKREEGKQDTKAKDDFMNCTMKGLTPCLHSCF